MKKSVTYWMVGGFEGETPIAQAAACAKSLGYEAIELAFGAGELTPATSEADLVELRKAVEDAGLEIASLATGHYWAQSLGSPDDRERAEAIAFTEAYLKAAKALGTDAVLVVAGYTDVPFDPSRPVVPLQDAYTLTQKSVQSLVPLAEKLGVCMALENVWNKFLTGPFEFTAFVDSFSSPCVEVYFDVGNCLINGYAEHWIAILDDRIRRVHFKNFARREGGGTLSDFTGSLLEGDVNWPEVFQGLERIGYNGYLTAEVIVSERGMPDVEMAAKVCNEMRALIEQYA